MPSTKTYTLRVIFDQEQITVLREFFNYVCIAKLVNGKYNVVWASQDISTENVFQWTEEYCVSAIVNATVYPYHKNSVEIAFGQTALLSEGQVMQSASGPSVGNSFTGCQNQVRQKIEGSHKVIYTDPSVTSDGPQGFTSSPMVLLFLSRHLNAGNVLIGTESATIPVSFTGNLEQTVSYVGTSDGRSGIWIIGSPPSPGTYTATGSGAKSLSSAIASGKYSAMTPHRYSVRRGFEPLGDATDAFRMAELINFYIHEFTPTNQQ